MKPKPFKVTFKKHKETGLARIGAGFYIEAKHKGQRFAILSGKSSFNRGVTIQIAIKVDQELSRPWEWFFLSSNSSLIENEEQAKEVLLQTLDDFRQKHELYFFPKE